MIGIISFVLCLVAWVITMFMTFLYELGGRKHSQTTRLCFAISMAIFAIVSYI